MVNRDEFCRARMAAGKSDDAIEWIKAPKRTLGEMDAAASRRLVETLREFGALRVVACEIDDYGEHGQNTGHLVVELPQDSALRTKLLKTIERLAREQGFVGDPDEGQRYAYIKLD